MKNAAERAEINRANAQKSTGPRTEEGKRKSSMNALRHGLTGQVTLMPAEDRAAHDKFCAALLADLAPEGALETQLAQSVAEDNWRLNRARAIETNIFALGMYYPNRVPDTGHAEMDAALIAASTFAGDPKKFQLLSLYIQRTSRDMQKSLDRLQALQAERKAARLEALKEAVQLHDESPKSSEITVDGFVFSSAEIGTYIRRKSRLQSIASRQIDLETLLRRAA